MNKKRVIIPKVQRDDRIGSVFNHLFVIISKTEELGDNVVWDFSGNTFFHPFFIVSLAIYRKNCGKDVEIEGLVGNMRNYFDLIHFQDFNIVSDNQSLSHILKKYDNKSYIPICDFKIENGDSIDGMESIIQNIIEKQSKASSRMKVPLSYLISELICNIGQHSFAESGYIFSQYTNRDNCINLCIADNGITVYGSYVNDGRYIEKIGINEARALQLANNGISTKNLPNAENRGYGIRTSKDMLVNGLKGSFFMLSGSAFHRHDVNGYTFVNLPKSIRWNGTIILMKIPVSIPEDFYYLSYIGG